MSKLISFKIPYSNAELEAKISEANLSLIGNLPSPKENIAWKEKLLKTLDYPTGCLSLSSMINHHDQVLILVEDNTRHTPVREILPILFDYLLHSGIKMEQLEIMIAPGTHRILSDQELVEKLGTSVIQKCRVSQHDFRDESILTNLGTVTVAGIDIPVQVNKKALDADFIIGIGNIIPHPNAGYSGGAKILDPGICGKATISATHKAAALLGYLPLGLMENPCRDSLEKVAQKAGLKFIINTILNSDNQVVDIVAGDVIKAHRKGAMIARDIYGIPIDESADIVISSSAPYDIDYWQCEKALVSSYFCVKEGGIIIFAGPCIEGLAHNHDDLLDWSGYTYKKASQIIRTIEPLDDTHDLVSAGIAMGATLVREKARIYMITEGLTDQQVQQLGYTRFPTLQQAVDEALRIMPNGKIIVLPQGGNCMPYIKK